MENISLNKNRKEDKPIIHTESTVDYMGVTLPKGTLSSLVPDKKSFTNFVEDDFTLALEQKIATAWSMGQPILLEGGSSIGKTKTAKKMCADLDYELHYINITSSTDPETLIGRYLPNQNKKTADDPEYIFVDGPVTKALRQEEGKIKALMLDELNSSSPATLIRLHEILDALNENSRVTLSEDAGEIVEVNNKYTKVVGLTNPPGKGYLERQPLDPAQIRRWVYHKEANELPVESFKKSLNVFAGLEPNVNDTTNLAFTVNLENAISKESLKDIPGLKQIIEKYVEFHKGAEEMLAARSIAKDQPQKFTFSSRDEGARIMTYISNFYNGNLTETTQNALRYYYAGKLLDGQDKQAIEALIQHVRYDSSTDSNRLNFEDLKKTQEQVSNPELAEQLTKMSQRIKEVYDNYINYETKPIDITDVDWDTLKRHTGLGIFERGLVHTNRETIGRTEFSDSDLIVTTSDDYIGMSVAEVYNHITSNKAQDIPGFELIDYIYNNPEEFTSLHKNGVFYQAIGTQIGSPQGKAYVPCVTFKDGVPVIKKNLLNMNWTDKMCVLTLKP